MSINFIPAPGYALALPLSEETRTSSGLITSAMKKDDLIRAKVVALGGAFITDQGTKVGFPFDVGAKIAFTGGKSISIDHQDYFIISRNNVLGMFSEGD